jgi:hypothetical protein
MLTSRSRAQFCSWFAGAGRDDVRATIRSFRLFGALVLSAVWRSTNRTFQHYRSRALNPDVSPVRGLHLAPDAGLTGNCGVPVDQDAELNLFWAPLAKQGTKAARISAKNIENIVDRMMLQ